MKKIISIFVLAFLCLFTLVGCNVTISDDTGKEKEKEPTPAEHVCQHVCPECGKCTDPDCKDAKCADKCQGHGVVEEHECQHVCPECGKCLDPDCTDPACADKCQGHGPAIPAALKSARDYLKAMYQAAAEATPNDFERVATIKISGVDYAVAWSVDVTEGVTVGEAAEGVVKIDVNEESETDIAYVLKAVITDAEGNSVELTWNHKVPAFKVIGWDEYVAAEKGTVVAVKGIITAIIGKTKGNSYNCLYVQDLENKGAYYAYGMTSDPSAPEAGLAEGMLVQLTGQKDVYSGTYELATSTGVWKVLDTTIAEVPVADYTEKFIAAEGLKDESIVAAQGLLVTLKGVTIGKNGGSDGSYYYFSLGGKETYVRISSSVCPLTKDDQKAFIASYGEHFGWTANVTGIINVYDGAFYLTPLSKDAFEFVSLPELDDAGMVAFEKAALSLTKEVTEACDVTLLAKGAGYEQVTITWVSDNAAAVINEEGNKVTFAEVDEDTTVKLTATLTSGEVTDTVEFEVKLIAPVADLIEAEVVSKAFALEAGKALTGKQVLGGTIVSIDSAYSEQYGNITVTVQPDCDADEAHKIQCFRLVGGADLAVGDHIVVTGTLKNYNGTIEFDSKCTYSKTLTVEEAKALVVVANAFALEAGKALKGKQVLAGTILTIDSAYSEQYGNITVTIQPDGDADETHKIQCFRLVGGADLAVGDHIVVTGTLKNYNGTIEFDSKCTYSKTLTIEEAKALVVVAEAFALEAGKNLGRMTTLTGTILTIDSAYSEQYKNITVTIQPANDADESHKIQCFRLVGGEDLAVGDVITVTGLIKNYNGTIEFDSKCTYVKAAAEGEGSEVVVVVAE